MRKRKTHIITYSTYAACGASVQSIYDMEKRAYVPVNGTLGSEIKSLCQVNCKNCRKGWDWRDVVRRLKERKASTA